MEIKDIVERAKINELDISNECIKAAPLMLLLNDDFLFVCRELKIQIPLLQSENYDEKAFVNLSKFFDKTIMFEKYFYHKENFVSDELKNLIIDYVNSVHSIDSFGKRLGVIAKQTKKPADAYLSDLLSLNNDGIEKIEGFLEILKRLKNSNLNNSSIERDDDLFAIEKNAIKLRDRIEEVSSIFETLVKWVSVALADQAKVEQTKSEIKIDQNNDTSKIDLSSKIELVNSKYFDIKGIYDSAKKTSFNSNIEEINSFVDTFKIMIEELEGEYPLPLSEKVDLKTVYNSGMDIYNIYKYVLSETDGFVKTIKTSEEDIQDVLREEPSFIVRKMFDDLKVKFDKFKRLYGGVEGLSNCTSDEAEMILKAYMMIMSLYQDIDYIKLGSYVVDLDRFSK